MLKYYILLDSQNKVILNSLTPSLTGDPPSCPGTWLEVLITDCTSQGPYSSGFSNSYN